MKKILISEKIKIYRKNHHLTQEEFGTLFGVSPQAISKWEKGDCYPDITLLPDIAELLLCSVNDFFSA
ncbi:MAG: helix-turn-helix transcriptional regulator [Clostridia bacterium]|nr:helix-turn-helix transcriptional regulator [Clostridia bacterium]MBQ8400026.1 helix-turn-helix transcriptional regulator [Clostridia bacterium]